jgi:hypothetical protein
MTPCAPQLWSLTRFPAPPIRLHERFRTVLGLVMEGVAPTTLELTLFYHWLRLTALLHGLSDAQCDAWTADMGAIMRPLVALLKELEPTLVDAGPTPAMAELGANVQQLKDALQALAAQPLMQADVVRHTDLANRAAFGLVQACLDAEVHPELIANVFLYYWLRASTINVNVPEPFFQTLERHWATVVERVAAFVEMLVHRTRS